MTSPPTTRLYRQATGPGHQSLQAPSCRQTQIDGAVDMQFLLLTVGLALLCGLQAQEESHEEPQENLEEVSTRGRLLPGGEWGWRRSNPERASQTAGGLPLAEAGPSGGCPGSRTAG